MAYTNITRALTTPTTNYVGNNWVSSDETTFLKKHILARGAYLVLTPVSLITSALDTIIGLGAGLGAICTLGKHKQTYTVAVRHLFGSKTLLTSSYLNFLRAINPEAKFSEYQNGRAIISGQGDGFLSNFVIQPLKNIATSCCESDNFLKRHVASRLTFALLALSCLVTRAIDGIIGIPAAALSILTGGKFESLNNLAFRTLQTTGIIHDLFLCTIQFINPWAGTLKA